MTSNLQASDFTAYPPKARQFAVHNLSLFKQLPLPLSILLLREIAEYDCRFPAERRVVDSQLAWLRSLSLADRATVLHGFASLSIDNHVASTKWAANPQRASEKLTNYLWSTRQVDAFREAADQYFEAWHKAVPEQTPSIPRLCLVILGSGLESGSYPTFLKLRPHGVFFSHLDDKDAKATIFDTLSRRATAHPLPYGHWYIDGGKIETYPEPHVTYISWNGTMPLRAAILARIQAMMHRSGSGPEYLRTELAKTTPADLGLSHSDDPLLDRFKIDILAEGSGTQIFSTTFVQWTAREVLRRAQPSTLLLRFEPRQRQLPMDELLSGLHNDNVIDPKGSFIDADIGAFYTWIDQQRLSGAKQSVFLAWNAESHQAIAIGPDFPKGTTAENRMTLRQILTV